MLPTRLGTNSSASALPAPRSSQVQSRIGPCSPSAYRHSQLRARVEKPHSPTHLRAKVQLQLVASCNAWCRGMATTGERRESLPSGSVTALRPAP